MLENSAVRWVIAVVAAVAIIALIAYARGDPNGIRRDPDRGHLGAPAAQVHTAPDVVGA
jgi:hypothetical protein